MTHRYWPLILTLAAAWGASYLFIKVGVDGGFSPAALMASRALIAGAVLLGYLAVTVGRATAWARLRQTWREAIVLGALNAAAPFWLVAWGETHIDSSIAAIAQATVPIFSLLIGLRFLPHERVGPLRIAGVCLGLAGVVLIAGVAPAGNAWAVAGTLAVVLASVFYASRRHLQPAPPQGDDLGPRAGDRLDARRRRDPAAVRGRATRRRRCRRQVRSDRCCCSRSSAPHSRS